VPASSFRVKGGLLFASDNNRSFWNADRNNYQPRLGFAYKLTNKLVLRGGWGVYTVPFVIAGVNQSGFSLQTQIVPSVNGLYLPGQPGQSVPDRCASATWGVAWALGADGPGPSFLPSNVSNSQAQRWSFGGQYELPGNWLLELQYVGNRRYDLVVGPEHLQRDSEAVPLDQCGS
jgi:hypothetical protein